MKVTFDVKVGRGQVAVSQSTNFCFNSMTKFGDHYLAANGEGLFELGGETDNGAGISSVFALATTNFGILNPKRLRSVLLGYEADDELMLSLHADDGEAKDYFVKSTQDGQQRIKVPINRDQSGSFWKIIIKNQNGADFSIDTVHVIPIVRSHGIRNRT